MRVKASPLRGRIIGYGIAQWPLVSSLRKRWVIPKNRSYESILVGDRHGNG